MNTFTVTKGRLKGTQIQARDKAHAQKLHKARLKRLKDKEMTFTPEEINVLLSLYDSQVGSLSNEQLQKECEADEYGYFGITSLEQADSIEVKLSYLATQIEKMRTNKEQA
jgi:hypothetical protein